MARRLPPQAQRPARLAAAHGWEHRSFANFLLTLVTFVGFEDFKEIDAGNGFTFEQLGHAVTIDDKKVYLFLRGLGCTAVSPERVNGSLVCGNIFFEFARVEIGNCGLCKRRTLLCLVVDG